MTDQNIPTTGTPSDETPVSPEEINFKDMLQEDSSKEEEGNENGDEKNEEEENQKEDAEEDTSKQQEESSEDSLKEEKKKTVDEIVGVIDESDGEADLRLMPEKDFQAKTREMVLPTLLKFFRPELINRFDDLIFFHPLRKEDLKQIVEIMIREPREMLREKNIEIRLSEESKLFLADKGYNPAFGARPLRRAIQEYIEDPLSDHLIREDFKSGDVIFIDLAESKDKLSFQKDVADTKEEKDLDPFAGLDEKSDAIQQLVYEFNENGEITLDDNGLPILKKAPDGKPLIETDELGKPLFDETGMPISRVDENGNPFLVFDAEKKEKEEGETDSPEEGRDIPVDAPEKETTEKKSFFSKIIKHKDEKNEEETPA